MKVMLPGAFVRFLRAALVASAIFAVSTAAYAQPLTSNVPPNLGTQSVGEVSWGLDGFGGSGGPYTWSVVAGALPPGVAIKSGSDRPNWNLWADASLWGIATTPGTYLFTLRVSDGVTTADFPTQMKITAFTVVDNWDLPHSYVGQAYSYQFTTDNAAGPVTFTNTTQPPVAGMSVSASGLLTITSPGPTAGTYAPQFCVTDTVDTICRSFNLYRSALKFTALMLPAVTQGQAYSEPIVVTGGTGPYTFIQGCCLPGGLTMNSAGVISGTPNGGAGSSSFSVTVTDSSVPANVYTRNATIVVIGAPPRLPQVRPYGGTFSDCTVHAPCTQGVHVQAGGTPPFTWSATGLPPGLSVGPGTTNWINPGDGLLSGMPTAAGNYSVTITVTDSTGASATNTFPLGVSTLADRHDFGMGGTQGVPFSLPLKTIGGTPPYTAVLTAGRLPQGLVINTATNTIEGTPLERGSFNMTLAITDSLGATLRTQFQFFIGNTGPSISNFGDLGIWTTGSSFSQTLFACCPSIGNVFAVIGGSMPPEMTLSSGGLLSAPALNTPGLYTFLVQVQNGVNASATQFSIRVTPMSSSLPFDLGFANVGTLLSQTLTVTGAVGAVTWTVEPGSFLPPGLQVQLDAGTWYLRGTPLYSGQHFFSLRATDSAGNVLVRGVTLSIYPAGGAPPVGIQDNSNLGTWSIGEVNQGLTPTGGNGTYSWSVVSGALPPGVALRVPPYLPPWFFSSQKAGLIGLATTPGTYGFRLRVTSGASTFERDFTMRITGFTMDDQFSLPDAFVGYSYSRQLTASGNTGAVTWAPNGLPPGFTISPTGLLQSTSGLVAGFYGVNVAITDSVETVFRTVSISVFNVNITNPPYLGNVPIGTGTTIQFNGSFDGGPCATCTFTASGLPGGTTVSSSGLLTIPSTLASGRYSLTVTATKDAVSYSRRFAFTVVANPAVLPTVNTSSLSDCSIGVPCSRVVNMSNGTSGPYSWSATGLPPGMTIADGDDVTSRNITPGDGELVGLPRAVGVFNVSITVTDGAGGQATQVVPLRISALGSRDSFNVADRGVAYTGRIRIIGGDPGGPSAGASGYTSTIEPGSGRLPAGLTLDAATQVITGTPEENGSFGFTLLVVDSASPTQNPLRIFHNLQVGAGTSTVSIGTTELPSGLITTAPADAATYSTFLSACCNPAGFTWTLENGTLPGSLVLNAVTGQISGSIAQSNVPGVVTLRFKATAVPAPGPPPPPNFAIRDVTLRLTTLSFPGSQSSTLPDGEVAELYSQTLTVTGANGALTWTLSPNNLLPPGLTLSSSGVLSGTPTAPGWFNFGLTVSDAAGSVTSRSYSLSVYPAGTHRPLNIVVISPMTAQRGTFSRSLSMTDVSGGVPPYTFSLTPLVPQVPGMRVLTSPPFPTFFDPATQRTIMAGVLAEPGTYQGSIRVTDSQSNTFDRAFVITVFDVALRSHSPLPYATALVPYSFQFEMTGGAGNYLWSSNNLPSWAALDPTTGVLSGTPPSQSSPSINITLTNTTTGQSTTSSFTLPINAYPISTSGVLPNATQNVSYSQQLSAPGCVGTCTWTQLSGSLPNGLSINSSGLLSGIPTQAPFTATFGARVTGTNGTSERQFLLIVNSPAFPVLTITNTDPNDAVVGGLSTFQLFAQGGTQPYTWSVASASLPPGMTLVSNAQNYSANFTTGGSYLRGRALVPGVYNFTLQVQDAALNTATRAFTWRISRLAFSFTSLPVSNGPPLTYNQQYDQALLPLGGSGVYPSFAAVAAVPAGLSFNPGTASFTGPPNETGTFTARIQFNDDAGNQLTQNITLNVGIGSPTSVSFTTPSNFGTVQIGAQSTFSINTSAPLPAQPLTISVVGSLPPGFVLQTTNPIIGGGTGVQVLGVPTVAGPQSFTLRADSATGGFAVRTFTFNVSALNVPAGLVTLPDTHTGGAYSQQLVGFTTGPAATWSVAPGSRLPDGVSLSGSGVLSGTPTQTGLFSFALDVSDGTVAIRRTYTLNLSSIQLNDNAVLPVATTDALYSYTFNPGAAASWTATGVPAGMALNPTTGELSGTPLTRGAFVLVVTATDASPRSITRRFTLNVRTTIQPVLDIFAGGTDLGYATVGQAVTQGLNANSGAPPYTFSVPNPSQLPPGLTLQPWTVIHTLIPGTAALSGAPTTPGTYVFTIRVTDSVGTVVDRSFTLRVTPVSILGGNPPNGTTGTAYNARFAAVGGGAMTFTAEPPDVGITNPLPPGITLAPNGTLSGTPTSTGSYPFRLVATDGTQTFRKTVTMVVNSPSNLRVTNAAVFERSVGGGFAMRLTTTALPAANFTWTLVSGSLPPGVAFATGLNPAQFPNSTWLAGRASVPGDYTFTVRATEDGNPGNVANHEFTFRISPMQFVAPAWELFGVLDVPAGRVGQPYSFALKVAGGVAPYTFVESPFDPLPAGITLSPTGVLSGTPSTNAIGNYLIAPIVTDSQGKTGIADGVTLTISPAGTAAPMLRNGNPLTASAGVPYGFALDGLLRGGTAPFTWSLASGQSLPPGLVIINGSSGVQSYLAGTPTTVQTDPYAFTLNVSDSSTPAQTMAVAITMRVMSAVLSPDAVPNGTVGTPYSQTFTPSGSAPPYTVQLASNSSLPPGLSFSGVGLLSGTPTTAGNYQLQVLITDGTLTTISKVYLVTIDNAAGQAPALSLSPKPINIYYEVGAPNPAPIPVAVNTTSGALPFGIFVGNVPGAALSASTGTTSTSVNLTINPSGVSPGTYTGLIASRATGAANLGDWTPVTFTVNPAPPCAYALNPQASSVEAAGGGGSFSVSAGFTCAWNASASAPWLHVTGGSSGTGNGTVSFTVDPNLGINTPSRMGTIDVHGTIYTVTQFGTNALDCTFVINPSSVTATTAGGTALVNITASNALCAWSATSATLSVDPAAGTGNGSVTVIVPPNTDPGSRQLTATIANHVFTAHQSGIDCSVALSPYSTSAPAAGVTGSVEVTTPAGCPYSTVLGPSWISVTSGGSGSGPGTLVYSVEANSTTASRSGSLTIGGQSFTVTQSGLACSVTVNTALLGSPYGSGSATGTIGITTNGTNCGWSASSGVPWASVAPLSGTGSVTINVIVQSNGVPTPRAGSLTVAGQTININQSGTACSYALETTSGAAPPSGGAGSVRVIAPTACAWTAALDPLAPWLTIVSSGTGGTSEVQFAAAANQTAAARAGTLTIANIQYTVNQAAAPCSYTINGATTSPELSSAGVSGQPLTSFTYTAALSGCSPSPTSFADWITVDSSSFAGTSGSVTYSVAPNPNGTKRTGSIVIGNAVYTVVQAGSQCAFSLNAYGRIFQAAGGSEVVRGTSSAVGCSPDPGTDQPSFVFLELPPILEGFDYSMPYTVTPFPVSLTTGIRFARITFGGRIVFIKQYSW